ncbi:hypothetical protein SO802_018454 [Lithocarpus litseifolius]|uniref:Reverse transcriptase domain-containing protein n=1 Tax=Lithocarpus litseifolius TaxID=425828 RepID=A0AAW2CKT2_9ROSI
MDLIRIHQPSIMIITETQVGGYRAKELTNQLPFEGALQADTYGYAGGIWLFWHLEVVDISKLASIEQEIHALVKVKSYNFSWLLSAIYASPRAFELYWLWDNLSIVSGIHDLPWVLLGDFNEVLCSDDKFGDNPMNIRRALSDVASFVRQGFLNLFSSGLISVSRSVWLPLSWPNRLTLEEVNQMSSEEIKEALWTLKPFKAPGPNGLPTSFFQNAWAIVGDSVINESAFVPGRRGLDNVIIAQEIIHTLTLKKGKSSFMAIKIDLEKAYDRLEWNFIRDVLLLYNLPSSMVDLIISSVSSSSISLLFNGGMLEPFLPSRGIRQGDPMSPYIFILCMEVLGYLVDDKCQSKLWDPVKALRGGLAVSHLFFANDLILFAKEDEKNCILRKLIASPLPLEIENLKVKDVFYNGVRHLDGLSFDISPQTACLIKSYPMRSVSSDEDAVIWISSHNGDFDSKNAYQIASSNIATHSPAFCGKWIWSADTFPKIRMFLWKCMLNYLPINSCLTHRRMLVDDSCRFYFARNESILHVLRDCVIARGFWDQVAIPISQHDFFTADLASWLRLNCCGNMPGPSHLCSWEASSFWPFGGFGSKGINGCLKRKQSILSFIR